jgi:hypothetical protein
MSGQRLAPPSRVAAVAKDARPITYVVREAPLAPGQTMGLYSAWRPARISIDAASRHPDVLVESIAMASVSLPVPRYQPLLQDRAAKALSEAQLETVIYAGEAHITRAAFGARLWTNNVKELIAKLERQSGEKTSSLEGLGRLKTDRVDAFSKRREDHLASLRAEQERDRNERRDWALDRQHHYRDRSPRGAAEHLADGARSIAQVLDRFLAGILDHARAEQSAPKTSIDRESQPHAPRPEPSHGPDR